LSPTRTWNAALPAGCPSESGSKEAAIGTTVIRAMTPGDLPAVSAVTDAAFTALGPRDPAPARPRPAPPALLFRTRLAADPDGCFVAVSARDPVRVTGVLISVARGTLGWLGPLAVHPAAQRRGTGERLLAACLDSWQRRGVRLMGLATFRDSAFHRRFYKKMGFRRSCLSIGFRALLTQTSMPSGIDADGRMPDLGFLYPGLDVSGEAAAAKQCGAGLVLTTEDGIALLHLESTLQPPGAGFVPFLAATTRTSFDRLLGAAEHLSYEQGKTSLFTRASSSSWRTMDALTKRGYQAHQLMMRMKAGTDPNYDRTSCYYLDSWL
jgi:predicted N-acetyltransferase YhbS